MATTNISKAQSSGSATNKFTLSFWVKRSVDTAGRLFSATGSSGDVYFRFNGDATMEWSGDASNASSAGYFITNRKFEDYSGWYNLVIRFDSTQGSASDRVRLYVNGVQDDSFSSYTDVNQNAVDKINLSGNTHYIGGTVSSQYFHGLMSHVHYCDGYSYGADSFGSTDATTGEWKITPEPSVTYGSNGYFVLKDGATLTDSSPNTNNFAVANGTLTNTEDCPSNVFATLNPLSYQVASQMSAPPTNGNTTLVSGSGSAWGTLISTIGATTGKYYFEAKCIANGSNCIVGAVDINDNRSNGSAEWYIGQSSTGQGYQNNGAAANGGASYGATYTNGDIIGVAMDLDNSKIYFHKNGTYQNSGVPTSGSTGTGAMSLTAGTTYAFALTGYASTTWYSNFGNGYFSTGAISSEGTNASGIGKFEYDVPTGYTALSTKGLNE